MRDTTVDDGPSGDRRTGQTRGRTGGDGTNPQARSTATCGGDRVGGDGSYGLALEFYRTCGWAVVELANGQVVLSKIDGPSASVWTLTKDELCYLWSVLNGTRKD